MSEKETVKKTELEKLKIKLEKLEEAEELAEVKRKIAELESKDSFKLRDGTEVKMREPKTRDVKKAQIEANGEIEKELMLIADLTGLTSEEIDDLSTDDYSVYQKKLKTFF